jgi:uncharacterized protein YdaU (DUF1376 family)
MTELPYMKLWIADHLSATAHLDPAEMGAYDRLLLMMWQEGGSLPNDPKLLARYCRMTTRQWERVAPAVMRFFVVVNLEEGSLLQSRRLTRELLDARKKMQVRAAVARHKPLKVINATRANGDIATAIATVTELEAYKRRDGDE